MSDKFFVLILLSLPLNASGSAIHIQMADPIVARMSDGSEYVIRAASQILAGTMRTHLIVNDETVDKVSIPAGNKFFLNYRDGDIHIMARCYVFGGYKAGMDPLVCKVSLNGEELGSLALNKLVTL